MGAWGLAWLALAAAGEPEVSVRAGGREVRVETEASVAIQDALRDFDAGKYAEAARELGVYADAGGSVGLRAWEAEAWWAAGELRRAERASAAATSGGDADAWALRGLILAELGRGPEANQAWRQAEARSTPSSEARVALGRCLVQVESGQAGASGACAQAARLGEAAGLAGVAAAARQNQALAEGDTADDALGKVAVALREGRLDDARQAAKPAGAGAREQVAARLAVAAIARAEGRYDAAAAELAEALRLARGAGLVRETAAALTGEGVLFGLAGRHGAALQRHTEAVGLLQGTHFTVQEVGARAEAGLSAARAGQLDVAAAQLAAARALPLVQSSERLLELEAMLAVGREPPAVVQARFAAAAQAVAARGWRADEARICVAAVEALSASDPKAVEPWATRAEAAFAATRDPLGPARVALARGLGRAKVGALEDALAHFTVAAKLAEEARAPALAALAQENAALALIKLGHAAGASVEGDAVARHQRFLAARAAYDAGLAAYNRGDHTAARTQFEAAYNTFRELGEGALAMQARRGRAWAAWNHAVAHPAGIGLPYFAELEQEGIQVGDAELEARAGAAYALGFVRTSPGASREAILRLHRAADRAESLGLLPLAAEVQAELAERESELPARAQAARRAFALAPDPVGAYAMYSVAFAAYQADAHALSVELCDEALPKAGKLAATLAELRANALAAAAP